MTVTSDVLLTANVACGTGEYSTAGVTHRVIRSQRVRPDLLPTTGSSKGQTVS
jgi:hypothetical protein